MTDKTKYYNLDLFDPKFGLKDKAWAIAHLLGDIEFSDLTDDQYDSLKYRLYKLCFPFYNGREQGIGLSFTFNDNKPALIVIFGECRNSDQIIIDIWESKEICFLNPPTVKDFNEKHYKNRIYLDFNEYDKAVEIIKLRIETFIKSRL